MNPRDIKRRANAIRKCRTGESYYDRTYKDLRVADLLLVLEDDNYHSEEFRTRGKQYFYEGNDIIKAMSTQADLLKKYKNNNDVVSIGYES